MPVLKAAGLFGPCDIQLRQVGDLCEVVLFPSPQQAEYLETLGLQRGADGVVVVAGALSWQALLG